MNILHRLRVPVPVQAAWFRALARLGIHVHPRDAELAARFRDKREIFETIRAMLVEDAHLTYVGHVKTRVAGEIPARTPENPGVPRERWDRYRQLLREVDLFAVSHVGDTITMRVSTRGSSSKGIVYSPAHRVVVASLEYFPLPPEQHAHVVLDEPWHLYYGWDT